MTTSTASEAIPEILSVEELIDRETLDELCRSAFALFGVSVRVLSCSGALLADVHQERAVCRYVNAFARGSVACARLVSQVRAREPERAAEQVACFTGARYWIEPIVHDGRPVGRIVLGPYRPVSLSAAPHTLIAEVPDAQLEEATARLRSMPTLDERRAERIAGHLRHVVELLLLSGHRAWAARQLQLQTVRESYRELAEKNERLQQAYERLQELDRLKSNFLATVSHELRTPLTAILGYAEMLESGVAGELNEEQLDFVRTIRTKGEQLLQLIGSLLDLTKLEQGTIRLRREPIDARALVEDVVQTLRTKAERKRVALQAEVPDALPTVHGDPVALRQVLTNLVDNAVKFTPPGGRVWVRVAGDTFEAKPPAESGEQQAPMGLVLFGGAQPALRFEVQDTGKGIPREARERIFDAFYQVDGGSTRAQGGAGLGLAIVKRLVDAMGGRIEVESEPGRGTRFTVWVPDSPPCPPA